MQASMGAALVQHTNRCSTQLNHTHPLLPPPQLRVVHAAPAGRAGRRRRPRRPRHLQRRQGLGELLFVNDPGGLALGACSWHLSSVRLGPEVPAGNLSAVLLPSGLTSCPPPALQPPLCTQVVQLDKNAKNKVTFNDVAGCDEAKVGGSSFGSAGWRLWAPCWARVYCLCPLHQDGRL